ncbi:ArsR/SmtB family transcription factor [Cellulomonas bogoriensis]|uniref:ArsR family transcriptional regulator n=1 Tax=Cellulomonas bogoriensis 69B4 = DSM 16987 TaxID=1386082 RepID=A0A0A0BRC1_9CELL|nr:metalloregulator ArsR/SmtB family transcription factor [Cellulomonas bogoriensis]KGM10167.1 ArsR family transcriptional regulator [Cellulomonas bogoriensis 69B4 = DSM 16987]
MHALDTLGDPVRRRIVEELATGDRPAGELARVVGEEFGISQPAVSRHLRVLREAGVVSSEVDAQRRRYSLRPEALADLTTWTDRLSAFWNQRLDALETEVARGQRATHRTAHREDPP